MKLKNKWCQDPVWLTTYYLHILEGNLSPLPPLQIMSMMLSYALDNLAEHVWSCDKWKEVFRKHIWLENGKNYLDNWSLYCSNVSLKIIYFSLCPSLGLTYLCHCRVLVWMYVDCVMHAVVGGQPEFVKFLGTLSESWTCFLRINAIFDWSERL